MSLQTGLNLVTLFMCMVTLIMATAALMPQIKQGLAILRDGLMWTILIGIIGFVGFVGWGRFYKAQQARIENRSTSEANRTEVVERGELLAEKGITANRSAGGVDIGIQQ